MVYSTTKASCSLQFNQKYCKSPQGLKIWSGISLRLIGPFLLLSVLLTGAESGNNVTYLKVEHSILACKPAEAHCVIKLNTTQNAYERMATAASELFAKYATDNASTTITAVGIGNLLRNISGTDHDDDHEQPIDADHDSADLPDGDHEGSGANQCARQIVDDYFPDRDEATGFSFDEFFSMLPQLLLASQSDDACDDEAEEEKPDPVPMKDIVRVWMIALVSVGLISLLSMVGVMIVPLMKHTRAFHRLLSYLIALAVGTLVGDALLHLLPHSLGSVASAHAHGEQGGHSDEAMASEKDAVMKNFVAVIGIYLFFVFESVMALIKQRKNKRAAKEQQKSSLPPKSSQPSERRADDDHSSDKPPDECAGTGAEAETRLLPATTNAAAGDNSAETSFYGAEPAAVACACDMEYGAPHPCGEKSPLAGGMSPTLEAEEKRCGGGGSAEAGEGVHHHHHHHHAHAKANGGILDVAWMVIVGDGLHNFSDGLAIGAAFSSTISAGLSTSVAVFCHELPHELGDFAILINAGMSIKQAVLYNALSAAFAFIGVVLGIVIGEYMTALKLWIITACAGGFLYVALVDMIPQLLASTVQDDSKMRFVCQNAGFLTGVLCMLLIALFEEQFHQLFL